MTDEQPAYGSLEMLRGAAIEQLRLVAFHAQHGAEQGDHNADAGMAYNAKRAIAHLRAAGDVLKLIHEHKQRELLRRVECDGAAATLDKMQGGRA